MIYGVTHFNCIRKQTQTEIRRQGKNHHSNICHLLNIVYLIHRVFRDLIGMKGFLLYTFLIALRPKWKTMLKAEDNEGTKKFYDNKPY